MAESEGNLASCDSAGSNSLEVVESTSNQDVNNRWQSITIDDNRWTIDDENFCDNSLSSIININRWESIN